MNILDKLSLKLIIGYIKKRLRKDINMNAILVVLKGKKTHIIAVVGMILGILQAFGIYTVPEAWWPILGALGLSALRLGVKDTKDQIDELRKP